MGNGYIMCDEFEFYCEEECAYLFKSRVCV